MPKRILILSASVGAGHTRAAQAVELALKELDPSAAVRHVDVLQLASAAFKLNNLATLPYKLSAVLEDPQRLAQLKAHARRLGKPQAAFDVARKVLAWPE